MKKYFVCGNPNDEHVGEGEGVGVPLKMILWDKRSRCGLYLLPFWVFAY